MNTHLTADGLPALLAAIGDAASANGAGPAVASLPTARIGNARARDWAVLVHLTTRVADVPARERAATLAAIAVPGLPEVTSLPTMNADVRHRPIEPVAVFITRVRREIEEMERAHAFELAGAAIRAVCRIAAALPRRELALALTHRGRILRQQSRLDEAEAAYGAVLSLRVPRRFHGIAWLGLAIVFRTRGNRPRELAAARRALSRAPVDSLSEANAHHILTNTYLSLDDVERAFVHAWRLLELVRDEPEREVGALINLGFVALQAGFPAQARHVFALSEERAPPLPRLRLSLFQGIVRAAGALRDTADLGAAEARGRAEMRRSGGEHHWEAGRLLYAVAEAWTDCGELRRAASVVVETETLARTHGLHELSVRADLLGERIGRAAQHGGGASFAHPAPAVAPVDPSPAVAAYADRLLTLST